MISKFLKLDNKLTFHYLERSKKENKINFLLIHGLSSSAFLWEPLVDEMGNEFNFYAIDLRGHGLSDKPNSGYDLYTIKNDVNLFIEKLNLENLIIIGQSMGVEISLLSSINSKHVKGCIGIDGGFYDLKKKYKNKKECLEALKPPDLNGINKEEMLKILRNHHPDWSEKAILGQFSIFEVDNEDKIIKRLELKNHIKILESLWDNDSIDNLKFITVPIFLILVNFKVNINDFDHDKIKIDIEKLEGDHDIHAQKPEIVSKIIKERLSRKFFG